MSIFKIAKEANKYKKVPKENFFFMALSFFMPLFITFKWKNIELSSMQNILEVFLDLNGSILGLAIAGYSISNVIPSKLMAFMTSTKAEKYPWSNFKTMLISYAQCFFALFSSILVLTLIYVGTYIDIQMAAKYKLFMMNISFSLICLVQCWVLLELKIFLFWIYDNSLMLGQAVTIHEEMDPFDKD